MAQKLLKSTQKLSREEAGAKLREIAQKMEDGRITLESGSDSIAMEPAEEVEFELDVEREEDGDLSIEMEIEWPEKPESGLEIR